MQNVAKAPAELKFRKPRLSNPKITAAVIQTPGALRALQVMGWEANVEEDTLVLPSNRQISFAQVLRYRCYAVGCHEIWWICMAVSCCPFCPLQAVC